MSRSKRRKFLLLRVLRAAGLLSVADNCRFLLLRAELARANRRFLRNHPQFTVPPAHLAFDAFNHVDWERYQVTGLQHARMFARVIQDRTPAAAPLDVLEWGCGPGRLIRHLPPLFAGREVRLSGTDYNPESIAWCRVNFPGMRFIDNQLEPPLPLPDNAFDVVYNFSVFTHLSQATQLAWAAELQRILKPGGWLISTTHGDAYSHLLSSAAERSAYAAGELVEQSGYQEGRKWFLAIHPPTFVRDRLLAGCTDVERISPLPDDGVLQDLWVARKCVSAPTPTNDAAPA
jgi:SAM-dependent methyltransferase